MDHGRCSSLDSSPLSLRATVEKFSAVNLKGTRCASCHKHRSYRLYIKFNCEFRERKPKSFMESAHKIGTSKTRRRGQAGISNKECRMMSFLLSPQWAVMSAHDMNRYPRPHGAESCQLVMCQKFLAAYAYTAISILPLVWQNSLRSLIKWQWTVTGKLRVLLTVKLKPSVSWSWKRKSTRYIPYCEIWLRHLILKITGTL